MVDTTEYVRATSSEKRISVQLVDEQSPAKRTATILPNAFFREFDDKDGEETKKVAKLVLMVDFLGSPHEWVVNRTTNEQLQKEFGSNDTDDWIGAVIKYIINDNGKMSFLTATLIKPPTGVSLSEDSIQFIRETKSYE